MIETKNETDRFGSCAFCRCGQGTHKHTSADRLITYLCDQHKEQHYDAENDAIDWAGSQAG